jgi:DNA-binding CsgD family transcriptional regulator
MNKEFFGNLLQVTTQSADLEGFLRNSLHNLWPSLAFSAAQFYVISPDGFLERVANYSVDGPRDEDRRIPFSATHPATIAAKTGQPCMDRKKHKVVAFPVRSSGWLQGVIALEPLGESFDEEELQILAQAVGSFISALSNPKRSKPDYTNGKPEQLTPRQLLILKGMDEGLIYAQIASNLHVSESLVKLEVTRIFRFFGVSGRAAALRAAREVLDATTPPPARINGRIRELVAI